MSAADSYFAFKLLKLLSTPFEEWELYKNGIIDENGNVLVKGDPALTKIHIIAKNLKKVLAKVPFGKTKLVSFAAALALLKEDAHLAKCILEEADLGNSIIHEYIFEDAARRSYVYFDADLYEDLIDSSGCAKVSSRPAFNILGEDFYEAYDIKTKEHYLIPASFIFK